MTFLTTFARCKVGNHAMLPMVEKDLDIYLDGKHHKMNLPQTHKLQVNVLRQLYGLSIQSLYQPSCVILLNLRVCSDCKVLFSCM